MSLTFQSIKEKQEALEFMELLKSLTEREQQQVKGIMIGLNLSKTNNAVAAVQAS